MPEEQAIDFMDNQINSRADLMLFIIQPGGAELCLYYLSRGADLNALSIEP